MDFADIAAIGDAMSTQKRPNTLKAYGRAWRRFVAWCGERGYDPLPADPWTVAAYLAHRFEHGRGNGPGGRIGPGTLEQDLKAIRHHHRQMLKPSPTGDVLVRRTMAGLRERCAVPPRQARALTSRRFDLVRETARLPRPWGRGMESERKARRRGDAEVALIAVMRDALLRCGEAAALQWRDVHVRGDGTGRLVIRVSKTNREPAVQPLRAGTVAALERIRPVDAEPTDGVLGMSPKVVNRTIARACLAAGLGEGFTGHSCRVGMAQDLTAAGFDLPSIMQAGRWKSPVMVSRYTERLSADRGAVAMLPEE